MSQSTGVSQSVQVGYNCVRGVREGISKQEIFYWAQYRDKFFSFYLCIPSLLCLITEENAHPRERSLSTCDMLGVRAII